jgi:selenocysteine lyase/cysteine desulfurase
MVSWLAMAGGAHFEDMLHYRMDWRPDARKFELATLGIQDYLGLARSVEILLEVGVEAVEQHIRRVQEPLVAWLEGRADTTAVTPLDPERRAGIFSFVPPDVDAAERALKGERVVFSVREGAIRLAPHFYNTVADMEAVIALIDGAC